jgi:hypothetical protein
MCIPCRQGHRPEPQPQERNPGSLTASSGEMGAGRAHVRIRRPLPGQAFDSAPPFWPGLTCRKFPTYQSGWPHSPLAVRAAEGSPCAAASSSPSKRANLRRIPRHGRRRLSARVTHRGSLALQPSSDDAVDSALARAGAAGAGDLRPGGSSGRPAVAEGRRRDPQGAVQESVGNAQSILKDGMI